MSDSRGLLVNTNTDEQVDLFLINHEEVSIQNKLTDDDSIDMSNLSEHVKFLPTEIHIEGKLMSSEYDREAENPRTSVGNELSGKPQKKMDTLIKMANDARDNTSFTFYSPSLPYTSYMNYYITEFSYNNEEYENAVVFSLTLEEIGLYSHLRRGKRETPAAQNPKDNFSTSSRYHASIKSPTEDGGGQKERGTPSIIPIDEVMRVKNLSERVEDKEAQGTPKGSSKAELITKLLGADEDLSERNTMLAYAGKPEIGVTESFKGLNIAGDIGTALNQQISGIRFPSVSRLSNRELKDKDILINLPIIGNLLDTTRTLPSESEFILEVMRGNKSTVAFTMRSPVMEKLRRYVIEQGSDVPNGTLSRITHDTMLSSRDNKILKDAFLEGINELRSTTRRREGLEGFASRLPEVSSDDTLTYYNYFGQPIMSFEGILDIDFDRWATRRVELGGDEYEVETYWNKSGFPVVSVKQTDGTNIIKQQRAFLGSDILGSVRSIPNLSDVHVIPFSLGQENNMTRGNIGTSIYFMVVYTNEEAINEVL